MTPRPVLLLVLCFEAGLATGLSHFQDPLAVVLIVAGSAVAIIRHPWAWLGAALAAGAALGLAASREARKSCAATLPAARLELTIRLREPVQDGMALAQAIGARCRGDVNVRVRESKLLPAGSRWRGSGRWIPDTAFGGRPAGIFVVAALSPLPGAPGPSERLRTWIARTTARLYGSRAGLVDALLVGRRGGIDPSVTADFARSGLVHLLSISGFHVGIILGWAIVLLRAVGLRRHSAAAWAVVLVFGYVGFLGWQAPALRAAFLAGVGAWSLRRQRQPAAVPLLAVTCWCVTLVDPWAVFDLGGWLSAAAFGGSLVFTRWSDRALGPTMGWRMLSASIGATVCTAPLTALAFGSVSLAGIGLNFVAVPLAAVAVPAVLASVMVAPVFLAFARLLAEGGGLGLAGLEQLAHAGSALPVGAWQGTAGIAAALPWTAVLAVLVWSMGRRNTSRRAALRLGWAAALFGLISLIPRSGFSGDGTQGLTLHFLSVGQGDAALIRTPHGRWILVDAGPADDRRNAGRAVILPFLVRHGVHRLAAFVLSHAHLDHVGGAPAVLAEVPADLVLEPAEPVAEPHYLALLDLQARQGGRWIPARTGDSLDIDGVQLKLLHPDTTWARWHEDLNDDSAVLLVRAGAFEAVLAGDLGVKAESLLAGHVGRVDLLKVGHHGSAGSTGAPWLHELAPKAAIISVGVNRYGHPSPATVARLAEAGVEVWRTDREGTVTVTVAESTMTVRGRRPARTYALRP